MSGATSVKKWDQNRSPVGWYLATYMERFEFEGEDKSNLRRRCRAWENTILVKAATPSEAYRSAVRHAKITEKTPWKNSRGENGRLVFEGLTHLVPIYDALEDGAEVCWNDHQNVSVQKIKSMVTAKHNLEAFRK